MTQQDDQDREEKFGAFYASAMIPLFPFMCFFIVWLASPEEKFGYALGPFVFTYFLGVFFWYMAMSMFIEARWHVLWMYAICGLFIGALWWGPILKYAIVDDLRGFTIWHASLVAFVAVSCAVVCWYLATKHEMFRTSFDD